MTNLKEETIAHIVKVTGKSTNEVKAILITDDHWNSPSYNKQYILKQGYNHSDYHAFLNSINIEYDSSFGTQHFLGTIWWEDGSYSRRSEYDGSEWWEHMVAPPLPEEWRAEAPQQKEPS